MSNDLDPAAWAFARQILKLASYGAIRQLKKQQERFALDQALVDTCGYEHALIGPEFIQTRSAILDRDVKQIARELEHNRAEIIEFQKFTERLLKLADDGLDVELVKAIEAAANKTN